MQHRNGGGKAGEASNTTTTVPMLRKQGEGSAFAPWLLLLKSGLTEMSNSSVAAYGAQILEDQEAFEGPLDQKISESDGEEKKSLIRVREAFLGATHVLFNYIEKCISPELRELVQSDPDYAKHLKVVAPWEPRQVKGLLTMLKKHVTSEVTADPTFQTLLSLHKLQEVVQGADETMRSYVDRIKDVLVRFETVSPHGRVFTIPDVRISRQLQGVQEERSAATRSSSSRDQIPGTGSILVKAAELTEVEAPEQGWVTKEYAVRMAIVNMHSRLELLRTEWVKRLTDGKSGQEVPADLEDLVNQVATRESMSEILDNNRANEVRVTVGARPGQKRPRGEDKRKCHYCDKAGHLRKDCRKRIRDDAKADKDKNKDKDKEKQANPDKAGRGGGTPGSQPEVKVTQALDGQSDGSYVDPSDIFRTVCYSEGLTDTGGMVCASAAGGDHVVNGIRFPAIAAQDDIILYDTGANLSILRNPYLVHNLKQCHVSMNVKTLYGIEKKNFNLQGTMSLAGVRMTVFVDPSADSNVLSAANLEAACRAQGYHMTKPRDMSGGNRPLVAQMEDAQGRTVLQIYYEGGLAKFSLDAIKQSYLTAYGQTIAEGDLTRAKTARALQRNLGHASHTAVSRMLARSSLKANVKSRDLVLAKDALGPSIAEIKGNFPRKKASIKRVLIEDAEDISQWQQTYADVFETMGIAFLISVVEPMHLIMTEQLASKGHIEIMRGIRKINDTVEACGFDVTEVHYDSDAKDNTQLAKFPNLTIHPPEQHVARAERGIRTVKETLRSFVQERPWMPWWGKFAVQAVAAVTAYIALRHGKNSKCRYSPYQQMTGRTPIAERDFKAAFGDLVLVENTRDDMQLNNVHRPRVLEAVWLRPNFDDHGSAKVLLLDTGEIVSRVVAKVIGWEENQKLVEALYKWSGAPRSDMTTKEVRFERHGNVQNLLTLTPDPGANVVWEEGVPIEDAESILIGRTSNAVPPPTRFEDGVDEDNNDQAPESSSDVRRGGPYVDYDLSNPEAILSDQVYVEQIGGGSSGNSETTSGALPTQEDATPDRHAQLENHPDKERIMDKPVAKGRKRKVDSHEVVPNEDFVAVQAALRPGGRFDRGGDPEMESEDNLVLDVSQKGRIRRKSYRVCSTEGEPIEEVVTTTIAKGMHQVLRLEPFEREKAKAAIHSEIRNLIVDHESLTGIHAKDVRKDDVLLPTNVFVDDKAVNGIRVKDKARIIARGDKQLKSDYAELSSQTVNTESVFVLLAIAASEGRALTVIDVKGAYLNADMQTPGGRNTIVMIDRELAKMFVEVKPELSEFVDPDSGRLYMRVDKALYGCVQSSALWQKTLTKALISIGFRICAYDECVAISADGSIILAFHVDDILVIGKKLADVEAFRKKFESIFTVTYTGGKELDYLGMHISVQDDGIHMSQFPMITKIVHDIGGTSNSPAGTNESEEFLTDERRERDAVPLDAEQAAVFRSRAASALYIAKRTRPDIMVAVNLLCRAAHTPTVGDNTALRRLLRYLSNSRNKHLLLPVGRSLEVEAHIDASFATDRKDRKSITGAVIFVGGAVVWAKSGKQSIVTKSSFEAELVALSDMASMVLWVGLFLRSLGFELETPTIFQDNQSTMRVANHGLSNNSNTKHIDIRHLWIKEVLNNKQLRLVYKKTDEMLADGMTKPLIGEKFYAFVKGLNLI